MVGDDAANSVVAFLRKAKRGDAPVLVVINFTPIVQHGYRIGVPQGGQWREVFNSDAGIYGGAHARSYRAGIRIDKTRFMHGWTQNSAVDILSRLALKPGKFAKWELVMANPDTVRPR